MTTCTRCQGAGAYYVRLGEPGQDTRQTPYPMVRWLPTKGPFTCAACNGTGQRKEKPPTPLKANIPWNETEDRKDTELIRHLYLEGIECR